MHELSRRLFLSGATAFAVWPKGLLAQPEIGATPRRTVWETDEGVASDAVMVRRLHLDLAGRIPTKDEARAYVYSSDPHKREALVDALLASDDFANYWAMRFCDILRVKSEFPINLWPNAVYVYHARIRAFVANDESWDDFGRALLTSQGSDFRDAEVNFFRATVNRTPEGWAEAVAQTFLGVPSDKLSNTRRAELAAFFQNVKIKETFEWKEEIVYVDGADRRGECCDRLFGTLRGEVASAFQKLVRGWIFGPHAAIPPSSGELHLKKLLREIVLSDEYARGSVTGGFPARRLDAEVLDDVICALSGTSRKHQSPAPEPFTFLPPKRATVCIEDGSISNGFLTLFGRPARDTGLPAERNDDVSAKQRLYLFNSGSLHQQLGRIVAPGIEKRPFPERVDDLYWRILSRPPTPRERQLIVGVWQRRRRQLGKPFEMLRDVAWCLVNTKEFLFRI